MRESIGANAIAMLAAKLLPPLFAFTVHVTVARLAGAEMLGVYVSLLAVLMIFQAIAGAGLQFLVARDLAALPEKALDCVRDARAFSFASGVAGTLLFLACAWQLLPPAHRAPAIVLAATILPSAWIALQEAVFIGTRTHHWVAVVAIVENAIKAGGALLALSLGYGLIAVCAAIAVARLAGLVTGSCLVRRLGLVGTWRLNLSAVVPFALAIAPFSLMYFRIDVPIVLWAAGERATGYYGAAATLYLAILLVPESTLAAAYPRLARAFTASPDDYARATWVIAKALTVGMAGLAVALVCFADPIVRTVYGPTFGPTVTVLRLLAIALPCHALNGALGQALQAGGHQRVMLRIVLGGVAAHVVLNVALVRMLGINGAALTMVLSSLAIACATLRALHTRVLPMRVSRRSVAPIAALIGPLAAVTAAPGGMRLAAGGLALAWLVAGAIWHGTLGQGDVVCLREAFETRSAGVTP
jgi:O-antigen/teichoic acid export membrane protein